MLEQRLFYWFVNRLPIGYLAASSTTEITKWFIDMPNNRFRMPNTTGRLPLGIGNLVLNPGDSQLLVFQVYTTGFPQSLGFVYNNFCRIL